MLSWTKSLIDKTGAHPEIFKGEFQFFKKLPDPIVDNLF